MIKNYIKHAILFLIQIIEKWEYRGMDLNEKDISKKIIKSISLQNLEIETDKGFKPITHIHKTQPYTIWRIDLDNGMYLEGADNHIIFDKLFNQIFIKNLHIDDYIQTKNGASRVINIEKYSEKVSMFDVTVDSEDHRFYSNGILSHNTTTIAAFFAWYLCFHIDRNLLILANKQDTSKEIVNKVVEVFKGLPFFMKPGIINIGALGLRLDNGCNLTSQATTKTASIGFTIHVLYIDEFAHINQKLVKSFWRSVYPTLSSSDISQCIISSTPDGMDNLFFDIWDKSQRGKNSFVSKRVDYWEVPGHDEKWAEKLKEDFGEEEFAQEYELSFDRKSNLLLSGTDLSWIKKLHRKYHYRELEKSALDESLYRDKLLWHPAFNPNSEFSAKTHRFIISNDIAEGKDESEDKDNDYNISSIFSVEPKSVAKLRKLRKDERKIQNMFRIVQVGLFRDNIGDEEVMAKVNQAIVFDQFNPEIVKMVTEMNFNGKSFVMKFSDHDAYFEGIFMHSYHTAPVPNEPPPRKKTGYKTTSNKPYFCKLGKKLIDQKIIIPTEQETYKEFGSFGKSKAGYKGIGKHDDTVMACLNISRFYEEPEYEDWLYDFIEDMPNSKTKEYILYLLEEPYESNDISDDTFSSLYGEGLDNSSEVSELQKIFQNNEGMGRYPGIGNSWKGNNSPWKKS